MFRALNGEMCDIGDEIRFCHGSGKCGGTTLSLCYKRQES